MKLRPFELILIVVFLVMIIGSLIALSVYKAPKNEAESLIGEVEIWGTLESDGISDVIDTLSDTNDGFKGVTYTYIEPSEFESKLVEALADGAGPDLVLIDHERLVDLRKRIAPVSYEAFPLRQLKDIYLDGSSIFALPDGMYAYPLLVDPLVMYYSKDVLTSNNLLEPPRTWEALSNDYLPALIKRNSDRTIDRSVVALGEYQNITNSFGIISTLALQAGSKGVEVREDGRYSLAINQVPTGNTEPLSIAVDFYTRFSEPNNTLYSWNRSFTNDKERFLSEDLTLYFGYASEIKSLRAQNPNLNIDVAEMPQGAAATLRRVYGKHYGIAFLRQSDNLAGAAAAVQILSGRAEIEAMATNYQMVPALRAAAASGHPDPDRAVAFSAAGTTYGWLSPNRRRTDEIFSVMIRDINEHRQETGSAVGDAISGLELEYN